MSENNIAILDSAIPRASEAVFQHLLNTYASETNKVCSVWLQFATEEMSFRPHNRSSTVAEIICRATAHRNILRMREMCLLIDERHFFAFTRSFRTASNAIGPNSPANVSPYSFQTGRVAARIQCNSLVTRPFLT